MTHGTPGWYFQAVDESLCTQGRTAVRAVGSCLCLCVLHFGPPCMLCLDSDRISHCASALRSMAGGALPQGQAVWKNACVQGWRGSAGSRHPRSQSRATKPGAGYGPVTPATLRGQVGCRRNQTAADLLAPSKLSSLHLPPVD